MTCSTLNEATYFERLLGQKFTADLMGKSDIYKMLEEKVPDVFFHALSLQESY